MSKVWSKVCLNILLLYVFNGNKKLKKEVWNFDKYINSRWQQEFCELLKEYLAEYDGFEVAGLAHNGEEAVEKNPKKRNLISYCLI